MAYDENRLNELMSLYGDSAAHGIVETLLPGVKFFWSREAMERMPVVYEAGIVFIFQGHKVGYLGDRAFRYDRDTYLVLSTPMPIECEAHGTSKAPLVGAFVAIDLPALNRQVALVERFQGLENSAEGAMPRGLSPVPLEPEMSEAASRLQRALCSRMEAEVLGPAIIEEILFRALLGAHGPALRALTRQGSHYARIVRVLTRLHRDFAEPFSVEDLAREAALSPSAFHRAFKEVTSASPLQYVKQVRLNKARSLIVDANLKVGVAAREVGYESTSQFSREFKRYFAVSPAEAHKLPYPILRV